MGLTAGGGSCRFIPAAARRPPPQRTARPGSPPLGNGPSAERDLSAGPAPFRDGSPRRLPQAAGRPGRRKHVREGERELSGQEGGAETWKNRGKNKKTPSKQRRHHVQ